MNLLLVRIIACFLSIMVFYRPVDVPFVIKKKIVIKDIKCDEGHNIALDINGDICSWGSNIYDDFVRDERDTAFLSKPKLIESIEGYLLFIISMAEQSIVIRSIDIRYLLSVW